jgi:6-phosphogluconolactonase
MYELLATPAAANRVDWSHTEVCFADERCVPPDDPASNFRMVSQALLDHVPLPSEHVHRIAAEQSPPLAADAYEAVLKGLLGVDSDGAPATRFDLVSLGLGVDGHTASLFPGSVDETQRWVSARPSQPLARITLTPCVLNAAESVFFVVSGAEKAERLAQVLSTTSNPMLLPAQRILPSGNLTWLVDEAAAARFAPRDVKAH